MSGLTLSCRPPQGAAANGTRLPRELMLGAKPAKDSQRSVREMRAFANGRLRPVDVADVEPITIGPQEPNGTLPFANRPADRKTNEKTALPMPVHYYTEDCRYRLPEKRRTTAWLHRVAEAEGYRLETVNYIFCSAARLLEMNRRFLGHDYFTDVITFDYSDRKGARTLAGDVFIDVETVADNARLYGATRLGEMRRVVVHGLLHLCGQKDKTPRTNAQMHRKEDKYLAWWEEPADNDTEA